MTIHIDMTKGVTEEGAKNLVDMMTVISQRHFSNEVLAKEGKRPSRERIARLFGRCVIDAESETAVKEVEADIGRFIRSNN